MLTASIKQMERARRRLPRTVFRFIEGGTEEELTIAANRDAFHEVTFRPRPAVEPSGLSLEMKVKGTKIPIAPRIVNKSHGATSAI
jgi:isopentenyl diphosphate isomerase/L-lactate dehydrogenase-like FMN-dependent dehydrogenase